MVQELRIPKIAIAGTKNSWRQQLIPVTCPGCPSTTASFQQQGQQQLQLGMGKTSPEMQGNHPKMQGNYQKKMQENDPKMKENDLKDMQENDPKMKENDPKEMQEIDPKKDAGK